MAMFIGSFAGGMWQGASNMMQLYSQYQNISAEANYQQALKDAQTQAEKDAADAAKKQQAQTGLSTMTPPGGVPTGAQGAPQAVTAAPPSPPVRATALPDLIAPQAGPPPRAGREGETPAPAAQSQTAQPQTPPGPSPEIWPVQPKMSALPTSPSPEVWPEDQSNAAAIGGGQTPQIAAPAAPQLPSVPQAITPDILAAQERARRAAASVSSATTQGNQQLQPAFNAPTVGGRVGAALSVIGDQLSHIVPDGESFRKTMNKISGPIMDAVIAGHQAGKEAITPAPAVSPDAARQAPVMPPQAPPPPVGGIMMPPQPGQFGGPQLGTPLAQAQPPGGQPDQTVAAPQTMGGRFWRAVAPVSSAMAEPSRVAQRLGGTDFAGPGAPPAPGDDQGASVGAGPPGARATALPPPKPVGVEPNAKVQIPSATTPATPSKTEPAPATTPGPVAVAGKPGQMQSETTPGIINPPVNPRWYAELQTINPHAAQVIDQIAARYPNDPQLKYALAASYKVETNFGRNVRLSSSGAEGHMQFMPGTRTEVDPGHQLDPWRMEDAMELAARYRDKLHVQLGAPMSSAMVSYAYMRGVGGVERARRDWGAEMRREHDASDAMDIMYKPGMITQAQFPPADPNAPKFSVNGMMERYNREGPEGIPNYLAETQEIPGSGMSAAWRLAELKTVNAALAAHHYDAVGPIQEWFAQAAHQGVMANLVQAHAALSSGNIEGARDALARGHAFFPDGTFGRFGIDNARQLWGQQFSEDHQTPIGNPMRVTLQGIEEQMAALYPPQKFLSTMMQMREANAKIALDIAHAKYYGDMPAERLRAAQEAADARRDAALIKAKEDMDKHADKVSSDHARVNTDITRAYSSEGDMGPGSEMAKDYEKKGMPDGMVRQSEIDRMLRSAEELGGGGLGGPAAAKMANDIMNGRLQLKPKTDAAGNPGWAVVDKEGNVHATLDDEHGKHIQRIEGSQPIKKEPAEQQRTAAIGGGMSSPLAAMQGMNTNLSNREREPLAPMGSSAPTNMVA